MPHHCYLCGSPIDPDKRHLRRKVRTGEWVRRSYNSKRPVAAKYSAGFRVVCARCARRCDAEEAKKDRPMWIELGVALAFLAWMLFAALLK